MPDGVPVDPVVLHFQIENYVGPADVALDAGRIVAIGPDLLTKGAQELDGKGCLAPPPFVDPHTHLDKSFPAAFA